METIIKITPAELNENLLNKIKKFIGSNEHVDVTISLKELDMEYANALDKSMEEAENTESLVTFTMDDFMAYTPSSK